MKDCEFTMNWIGLHRRFGNWNWIAGLIFGFWPVWAGGYQNELPDDVQLGLREITSPRVTQTIAFLASDEMAGRGTPSKEFTIATAYVAARFRGAGLKGGGTDGSYYQEQILREVRVPETGVRYQSAEGKDLPHFGLLAASAAWDFSGPVTAVDLDRQANDWKLNGAVTGVWQSDATGPRLLSQLARLAHSLSAAGARALLLQVKPEHELIQLAAAHRAGSRIESERNQIRLPILLVPVDSVPGEIFVELPGIITHELPMRNVIGILEGSDPELKDQAIIFSAHLDHLGTRAGTGDGIFNGADDDASGCTAVLTLADAFAAMPSRPKRSLIFMTFWGEESGLLGSRQFAAQPTWPLGKIVANLNLEMIGRPEAGAHEKIWMTGWQESDLGQLMNADSARIGVEIFEHPRFSAMLYRASDNWSLVEKGVIAHSFSAGSLHEDYHQPDDEWERLNIPHMTRVIAGLFVGSQGLADGSRTPRPAKSDPER